MTHLETLNIQNSIIDALVKRGFIFFNDKLDGSGGSLVLNKKVDGVGDTVVIKRHMITFKQNHFLYSNSVYAEYSYSVFNSLDIAPEFTKLAVIPIELTEDGLEEILKYTNTCE